MSWTIQSDRPIYLQLMEQIQHNILSGAYPVGEKLPSVRDLAADASVNPNTMQKALVELEKIGLLTNNRTNGRQITDDRDMLEKMKYELATEKFHVFIKSLKQLGFKDDEIIHFVTNAASDEWNEHPPNDSDALS